MSRVAIQILSYNRPQYLKRTLQSLYSVISKDDKICVFEQSDDKEKQKEAINVAKEFPNINIMPSNQNHGQRKATNIVFASGFFNDADYVMLTDQDNDFYEPLGTYCDRLDTHIDAHIVTGLV